MDETYKKKIRDFYRNNKRMPSYGEIMHLVGFRSKGSVTNLVTRLVRDGFLSKDTSGKLIPKKLHSPLAILGIVEAGFPSPAEEELVDVINIDDYLIENKEATYLLTVKGDSMIDAGIMPGDLVVVERTSAPKIGEIVIAEVDGEWTMKYLRKKNGVMYLEAANQNYPPIYSHSELKIEAVVRGVIRKY
ncbi:MAG: transcriptional repressor LexA [bacterium]|nr:transcriptional repressor LexA [bacterium]